MNLAKSIYLFLVLFFVSTGNLFGASATPTIAIVGGTQYFCIDQTIKDTSFTIIATINNNGFMDPIDHYEINWGEGPGNERILPSAGTSITHTYVLRKSASDCDYEKEVTIKLKTYRTPNDDLPTNNAFDIFFRNPPNPGSIAITNSVLCKGLAFNIGAGICEANKDISFTLSTGQVYNTSPIRPVFNTPGTYTVTMSASNFCGTRSTTRTLTVVGPTTAEGVPDSGLVVTGTDFNELCLVGPSATIRLNAGASPGASSFEWKVLSPGSGYNWRWGVNSAQTRLEFTAPGKYVIKLTVDNTCMIPSAKNITVNVVTPTSASLQAQADGCVTLSYTPSPFTNGTTYYINGTAYTNFPITLPEGAYHVAANVSNACGVSSISDTFAVANNTPISILSPSANISLCKGSPRLTLTAEPAGGTWSGSTWISGGSSFIPTIAGSYRLKYSRGSGTCYQEAFTNITVIDTLRFPFIPSPDTCQIINYTPSPLNPNLTYQVNNLTVTSFPLTLSQGTHIVRTSGTNICGETVKLDTFVVAGISDISIQNIAMDQIICSSSGLFELNAFPNGGTWTGTNVTNQSNKFYFNPKDEGTFLLKYKLGSGSCANSDSVRVITSVINAAAADLKLCNTDQNKLLTGTPSGGTWIAKNCLSCLVNDSLIVNGIQDSISYFDYLVQNSDGCKDTATIKVTKVDPDVYFTLLPVYCEGATVDLIVSTNSDLRWYLNDTLVSPPPFVNMPSGEVNVKTVATNGTCKDSLSLKTTVLQLPINDGFSLNKDQGCAPLEVTMSLLSPMMSSVSYEWNIEGQSPGVFPTYSMNSTLSFYNNSDTVQRYKITFKAYNICKVEVKTSWVSVLPFPKAKIGIDGVETGCSPLTLTFINQSTGNVDGCNWNFGNDSLVSDCKIYIPVTFLAKDTTRIYNILLRVQNECGQSSITREIAVTPPDIHAFFSLNKTLICPNEIVNLTNESVPIPQNSVWDFGNGQTAVGQNAYPSFAEGEKIYKIKLKVFNHCGYDSIVHEVKTQSLPHVNFEIPDILCVENGFNLTNVSNNENARYIWEYGDGSLDTVNYHGQHAFNGPNLTNRVKLTAISYPTLCANSISKDISLTPGPIADFSVNQDGGCAPLVIEFTNNSENANGYLWTFDDGAISTEMNPVQEFGKGFHKVSLVANYLDICFDTMTVFDAFQVYNCDYYIPNVFSPNKDGQNDFFTVFGNDAIADIISLNILDRWGNLLWEGKHLKTSGEKGWDGKLNGQECLPGAYVYTCEILWLDNHREKAAGTITLVK